jgi:hypothetical protein
MSAPAQHGRVESNDQADRYRLNPGEAFAEAYRICGERRLALRVTAVGAPGRFNLTYSRP